jgi:hypothetical protein
MTGINPRRSRSPRKPVSPTDQFLESVKRYDAAKIAYDAFQGLPDHEQTDARFNVAADPYDDARDVVLSMVLTLHGQPPVAESAYATGYRACSVRHPDGRVFVAGFDLADDQGAQFVLTIISDDDQLDLSPSPTDALPCSIRSPDDPDVAEAARGAIHAFRNAQEAKAKVLASGADVVDRTAALRLSRLWNAQGELVEAVIATDPAIKADHLQGASQRHWRPRGAILGDRLYLAVPCDVDEEDLANHADGARGERTVTQPLVVDLADIVSL